MDKKVFDYKQRWHISSKPKGIEKSTKFQDFGTNRINPDRYISKKFMDAEWEKIWKAGYENGEQVEWDKRSLYIGGHSSTLSEHNNTKWNKFKLRLAMFREKQD